MLSLLRTLLYRTGQDRGFTLIELLIVVLIVGILAAVGTPLYLGYVRDARAAEGKSQVGALWTALQTVALSNCGTAQTVDAGYSKAGFTSAGVSADARWSSASTAGLTINCDTGVYTAGPGVLFTLTGTAAATDVTGIAITLNYDAAHKPPSYLQCQLFTTAAFSDC